MKRPAPFVTGPGFRLPPCSKRRWGYAPQARDLTSDGSLTLRRMKGLRHDVVSVHWREMSEHPTYNLSFTAASLRPELSRIVAEAYLSTQNWELAKAQILSGNALQCRSASSAVRLERELRQRLQRLTENQLRLLANAPAEDRAAMCWLAACKHIQFAFDFAAELLREKLTALDTVLWPSDYESFVQSKELSQPELRELAPSSKAKVRQVLLRMLLEAGLLVPGRALGNLQRPVLSLEVREAITSENPLWLAAFLVPENELPVR